MEKTTLPKLSKAEYDRIVAATAERDATEPRAAAAYYDAAADKLVVELRSGVELRIPTRLLQGVASARPEQIAAVEVRPSGYGLHWEALDADLSVPGLAAGIFGSKGWMSEVARQLGGRTSPRKAAAARANGARGWKTAEEGMSHEA